MPLPVIAAMGLKTLAKKAITSKAVKGIAGKAIGAVTGKKFGATARRKSRFSIAKLQKRLISAKINAKIQRTRLSAFRGL